MALQNPLSYATVQRSSPRRSSLYSASLISELSLSLSDNSQRFTRADDSRFEFIVRSTSVLELVTHRYSSLHTALATMIVASLETENAVEIKYDASAHEYTVICACREPQQCVTNSTKRADPWTILSVVVIDAIHNSQTTHSDLTGRMSCTASTASGWPIQSRTLDSHRPLSPLHQKGRQSALDAHRSFSRSALESSSLSSASVRTRQEQGRWIVSSSFQNSNSSLTPRASGRTRRFNFMPSTRESSMYRQHQLDGSRRCGSMRSVRPIIVFDKDALLMQAQDLQHSKSSFRL